MKVLLYLNDWEGDQAVLSDALREAVRGVSLETCHRSSQLERLVSRPGQDWAAVVAAVGSSAALQELGPWREQLSRLGLLLILPSQDEPFVALGHRMAPRFLACGKDAPALVGQVLGRMIRNRDSRAQGGQGEYPQKTN